MSGLGKFFCDTRGNTALVFSLAAIPMMLGVGAAVDFVHNNDVTTVLQGAADAAALAGATSKNTNATQYKKIVMDYLTANGVDDIVDGMTKVTPLLDQTAGTFSVKIEGKVNTSFMHLAGINQMNVKAFAEVALGGQGLEVALVLDNTASMNSGGRLPALKSAAKELIDTVLEQAGSGAYVRVGIVPFADYVNVGVSRRNENWMSVPPDSTTTQNVCNTSYPNAVSSNCHDEQGIWNNDGVPTPYTYQVCDWNYGTPVTTCADQTWNNTWNGCVGSRANNYDTKITGVVGKPYPGLINFWCPQEIALLSDNKTALKNKIDAMNGTGETYIAPGVLWGWNVLDPEEPLGAAKSHGWMMSNRGTKAMVVMTDGDNTKAVDLGDPKYHWSTDVDVANDRTATLCQKVKDEDIVVYTVSFMVTNPAAQDLLKDCASDPSKAFVAGDAAALSAAFNAIADSLLAFRLTK